MKTSNLRRRLTHLVLAGGLAAALTEGMPAQDPAPVRGAGRGFTVANPVPQGQGWVNPRRPSVGQGDGQSFAPRHDRDHRGNPRTRYHHGLDLAAPVGTAVQAPISGTVIRSIPNWRGENANGNEVRILGDDGREYWFFHLSGRNQPAFGERIEASQPIGEVGRTAIPPGAASHVHVEVRQNGQPLPLQSVGGDPQAGLWSYIRSQPQTTQAEADMINRYTGQPLDRQPSYSSHPSPAAVSPPLAQEPSLLQRLWDAVIPSAGAQSMPEGERAGSPANQLGSAGGDYGPGDGRQHATGATGYGYDESNAGEVPLPEASGHIRREDSIEGDFQPHEGAQWLWEDHREGAAPASSGAPGGDLYLPGPAPEAPSAGSDPAAPSGEFRSPDILTLEQLQVEPATPAPAPPGLTPEQFRRELDRTMDQFRQADEFNQQNPLELPQQPSRRQPGAYENPSLPERNEYSPSLREPNPRPIERFRPLDPAGEGSLEQYSPQSPATGYQRQSQRQNRVYRSDGYSYPIGSQFGQAQQQFQQMQDWSNEQIRRLNQGRPERSPSGRYYDYGSGAAPATPVPTPAVTPAPSPTSLLPENSTPTGSPRPTYSIGFDDDAPRGQGRTRFGYDESTRQPGTTNAPQPYQVPELPSGPGVERRMSGNSAATASLAIP